jgi:hypothetical protein
VIGITAKPRFGVSVDDDDEAQWPHASQERSRRADGGGGFLVASAGRCRTDVVETDRYILPTHHETRRVHDDAVRRVALLRHGEKKGRESRARLSSTGRMRAFALPHLVVELSRREGWPLAPDCLIAAHDKPSSVRPSETLLHLAQRLSLPVHHCLDAASVKAWLFGGSRQLLWRHAVVSWRHDTVLDVARALGASSNALPSGWPDDLYDRLILLDFDARNDVVEARCVYTDAALRLAGDPPHSTSGTETTHQGREVRASPSHGGARG